MNNKKIFATMLVSAMLLTGCGFKKDVIVKVNGESLRLVYF